MKKQKNISPRYFDTNIEVRNERKKLYLEMAEYFGGGKLKPLSHNIALYLYDLMFCHFEPTVDCLPEFGDFYPELFNGLSCNSFPNRNTLDDLVFTNDERITALLFVYWSMEDNIVMKKEWKEEKVWIVVNDRLGAYVDFRFTRKEMKRHHCETCGYMNFEEAEAKGDKCVRAILQYNV